MCKSAFTASISQSSHSLVFICPIYGNSSTKDVLEFSRYHINRYFDSSVTEASTVFDTRTTTSFIKYFIHWHIRHDNLLLFILHFEPSVTANFFGSQDGPSPRCYSWSFLIYVFYLLEKLKHPDGFNFHLYLGEFQTCISVSIQCLLFIRHFLLFISWIAQIWQLISLLISSLQMSSHFSLFISNLFFSYQSLIFTYLKEQRTLKCILYPLSFPRLIINYGNYECRKYNLK